MAKFLYDTGRWTVGESWRTVRNVRANVPTRFAGTLKGERKIVFHAALEQAQQQFSAAASIGYESRPLNLFYGLAQAGRALAAASDSLRPNHPDAAHKQWESTSHGLTLQRTLAGNGDLWHAKLKYEPTPLDSFSRVALALASPTDVGAVELGALAAQVPEFTIEFRDFTEWPDHISLGSALGHAFDGVKPNPAYLALRWYSGPMDERSIRSAVDQYPAIRGLDLRRREDGLIYTDSQPEVPYLIVPQERVVLSGTTLTLDREMRYAGGLHIASPALGSATDQMHPLLVWWSLLFSFSILARYHPKEWTNVLSLGSNPAASRLSTY